MGVGCGAGEWTGRDEKEEECCRAVHHCSQCACDAYVGATAQPREQCRPTTTKGLFVQAGGLLASKITFSSRAWRLMTRRRRH